MAFRIKLKSLVLLLLLAALLFLVFRYVGSSGVSIEQSMISLWEDKVESWGYVILFVWSILEGEWGLLLSGVASHQGYMNLYLSIFIAGLGGFVGDQIYFYIGRFNKGYVQMTFRGQRRKFAMASVLMRRYGWGIIFVQRYMYGFRTVIPISIGLTNYSAVKFAVINLISAWVWASLTIVPAWFFGGEILTILKGLVQKIKQNQTLFFVLLLMFVLAFLAYFALRRKPRASDYRKDDRASHIR